MPEKSPQRIKKEDRVYRRLSKLQHTKSGRTRADNLYQGRSEAKKNAGKWPDQNRVRRSSLGQAEMRDIQKSIEMSKKPPVAAKIAKGIVKRTPVGAFLTTLFKSKPAY